MYNSYWIEQEKIFSDAIKNVKIPNASLDKVNNIIINTATDLSKIPDVGGCYWIWTNEPVVHTLHKHPLPNKINDGEIIYNGIAKDKVRERIEHHLFGKEDAGWSGISLDIYQGNSTSHRKKAMSVKGKVPYIKIHKETKRADKKTGVKKGDIKEDFLAIKNKKILSELHLSQDEKKYIAETDNSQYFFRNGINITENKHNNFEFRIYFIIGLSSLYLEYIEKMWRKNGLPKLCSYSTGR